MFKNVKVHYPKRKLAIPESEVQGIPEPVRETMYDIVLENFQIADRKTFIHRIIYVGEHTFPGSDDKVIQCFQNSIDRVNESFCLEPLTGFLLCYRRHFVHMIEGDEDSINSHLRILLNDNQGKQYLGVMKLLIHVSHINRRYVPDWAFYKGIPPNLLGQIDPNSSLEDSGRQIYNCIKKVYNFVASYVDDNYYLGPAKEKYSFSLEEEPVSVKKEDSSTSKCRASQMSFRPTTASIVGGIDPYRAYLPEVEVLNFIIVSTFTQTLADYHEKYGVVPQRDIYKDKVWPVPSDFIPYDVFEKPYDNITDLPKPTVKTESESNREKDAQNDQQQENDTDKSIVTKNMVESEQQEKVSVAGISTRGNVTEEEKQEKVSVAGVSTGGNVTEEEKQEKVSVAGVSTGGNVTEEEKQDN